VDSKENGLKVKVDTFKYMVMSRNQTAGRNNSVKNNNSFFERVENFRYLGKTLRDQEILVGKPEGKRPLGRPRHRWECNIRMDLQEVGCGVWTGLVWFRQVAGNCECGNEPSYKPVSFSRRPLFHGVSK
jgi:hypothetical protein